MVPHRQTPAAPEVNPRTVKGKSEPREPGIPADTLPWRLVTPDGSRAAIRHAAPSRTAALAPGRPLPEKVSPPMPVPAAKPIQPPKPKPVELNQLQLAEEALKRLAAAMQALGRRPDEAEEFVSHPDIHMPLARTDLAQDFVEEPSAEEMPMPLPEPHAAADCAGLIAELVRDRKPPAPRPARRKPGLPPARAVPADARIGTIAAKHLDGHLARLVAIWPQLPPSVQDAISAIVQTLGRPAPRPLG